MKVSKNKQLLQKRRWRIRKKIKGTSDIPRLSVYFSNQHIYAQCIDDVNGKTIAAISTVDKSVRDKKLKPNQTGAAELGKLLGEKAKEANVEQVVFDRNGRRYHGCVKAFADATREAGVSF